MMQSSISIVLKDFFSSSVPYFDLSWGAAIGSFSILLFSYALRKYIVEGLLLLLGRIASKTETEVDDLLLEVIRVPLRVTVVYFGILAAIWILPLEKYEGFENIVFILFRLGAIIILAWTAIRSIKVVSYLLRSLTKKSDTLIDDKLVPFVKQILRILAIVIAF